MVSEPKLSPIALDADEQLKLWRDEYLAFTYAVSHDLHSPLANAKGLLMELKISLEDVEGNLHSALEAVESEPITKARDTLKNDAAEMVAYMEASFSKMERMFNQLLELSRDSRREIVQEQVDLAKLVGEVRHRFSRQLQQRQIVLEDDIACSVWADPISLDQVLDILVDNAWRHSDSSIRINVQARLEPPYCIIQVSDDGPGIPLKERERIFSPFRKLQHGEGQGMGLAIARALIHRHHGKIQCESAPGLGATFTIYLPMNPADDARASI